MDLRKLKTLIDLVAESDIAELEVTEGESKVRIVKSSAMPQNQMVMMQPQAIPQYRAAPPPPAAPQRPPPRRGRRTDRPRRQIADGRHLLPLVGAGRQPSWKSARPSRKATPCASSKR
jgi:biotin carboxyl carrier protein